MTNFQKLQTAVSTATSLFDNVKREYDKQKTRNSAENKALRRKLKYSRARTRYNRAQCIDKFLDKLLETDADLLLDSLNDFTNMLCSLISESETRERFVIKRSDDIMSLVLRYDNFSMKKVLKYCEAHNIKLNKDRRTFDFSKCTDDDDDDDYDEEGED